MQNFTCQVINQKGMHARAAAKIVELANQFDVTATLSHQKRQAPANSLIKLLTLDAPINSTISIECHGKDQATFSKAIQQLFNSGFGETAQG